MSRKKHAQGSVVPEVSGVHWGLGTCPLLRRGRFLYHKSQSALPPKHLLSLITILGPHRHDPRSNHQHVLFGLYEHPSRAPASVLGSYSPSSTCCWSAQGPKPSSTEGCFQALNPGLAIGLAGFLTCVQSAVPVLLIVSALRSGGVYSMPVPPLYSGSR